MLTPAEQFLSEVDDFLARAGMAPSVFGEKSVKDPNFVRDLRAGREPRFETVRRVREFISSQDVSA